MAGKIIPKETKLYIDLFDEIYSNPDTYKKLLTSDDANKQIEGVKEAFFNVFGDINIQKANYESFDKTNVFIYIKVNLIGSKKHTYNLYVDKDQNIKLEKWSKANVEYLCQKLAAWELECRNLYRRYQPYHAGTFNWTTKGDTSTGVYGKAKDVTLSFDHKKGEFAIDIPRARFTFQPKEGLVNLEEYRTVSIRFLNAIKMMVMKQKPILGID